jgi:GrpB-like predicted nucleotidyltransferase (UPF0157 family)
LRANQEAAKRYETIKLELAKQFTDTNEYAAAKNEICNELYAEAKAWKKSKIITSS